MATIAENLQTILDEKNNIKDAINRKGGNVEDHLADYAPAIDAIKDVSEELKDVTEAISGVKSDDGVVMANAIAKVFTNTPTEQRFMARSINGIKDGVAYVEAVKGNSLKVAQVVQNGDFKDGATKWYQNGAVLEIKDGVAKLTKKAGSASGIGYIGQSIGLVVGHTYMYAVSVRSDVGNVSIAFGGNTSDYRHEKSIGTTFERICVIKKIFSIPGVRLILWDRTNASENDTITYWKDVNVFDLTAMFGEGNEPSTPEEFAQRLGYESVNNIPYFEYDEGSLVSFNGKGIEVKGRNLIKESEIFSNSVFTKNDDGSYSANARDLKAAFDFQSPFLSDFKQNTQYTFYWKIKVTASASRVLFIYTDGTQEIACGISSNTYAEAYATSKLGKTLSRIAYDYANGHIATIMHMQVTEGTTSLPYTPYNKDSYPLPISQILDTEGNQLFPYGLLSAGDVYDEIDLEKGKAIKRIGVVDMGTLVYSKDQYGFTTLRVIYRRYFGVNIPPVFMSPIYSVDYNQKTDLTISYATGNNYTLWFRNDSYTDVSEFKNAMQGVPLYYELETPIEVDLQNTKQFYKVQNGGTEKVIADGLTTPITANIGYNTYMSGDESKALLTYANEVTNANDTTLGDAVKTLADGYNK